MIQSLRKFGSSYFIYTTPSTFIQSIAFVFNTFVKMLVGINYFLFFVELFLAFRLSCRHSSVCDFFNKKLPNFSQKKKNADEKYNKIAKKKLVSITDPVTKILIFQLFQMVNGNLKEKNIPSTENKTKIPLIVHVLMQKNRLRSTTSNKCVIDAFVIFH